MFRWCVVHFSENDMPFLYTCFESTLILCVCVEVGLRVCSCYEFCCTLKMSWSLSYLKQHQNFTFKSQPKILSELGDEIVEILSVDHSSGAVGKYFNYKQTELDGEIGHVNLEWKRFWDGSMEKWRENSHSFCDCLEKSKWWVSVGEAHGRLNSGAANPQFQTGDILLFAINQGTVNTYHAYHTLQAYHAYQISHISHVSYTSRISGISRISSISRVSHKSRVSHILLATSHFHTFFSFFTVVNLVFTDLISCSQFSAICCRKICLRARKVLHFFP